MPFHHAFCPSIDSGSRLLSLSYPSIARPLLSLLMKFLLRINMSTFLYWRQVQKLSVARPDPQSNRHDKTFDAFDVTDECVQLGAQKPAESYIHISQTRPDRKWTLEWTWHVLHLKPQWSLTDRPQCWWGIRIWDLVNPQANVCAEFLLSSEMKYEMTHFIWPAFE